MIYDLCKAMYTGGRATRTLSTCQVLRISKFQTFISYFYKVLHDLVLELWRKLLQFWARRSYIHSIDNEAKLPIGITTAKKNSFACAYQISSYFA